MPLIRISDLINSNYLSIQFLILSIRFYDIANSNILIQFLISVIQLLMLPIRISAIKNLVIYPR